MPNKLTRQEIIESRKLIDEALDVCHSLVNNRIIHNKVELVSKLSARLFMLEGYQRESVTYLLAVLMQDSFEKELHKQEQLLLSGKSTETVQ